MKPNPPKKKTSNQKPSTPPARKVGRKSMDPDIKKRKISMTIDPEVLKLAEATAKKLGLPSISSVFERWGRDFESRAGGGGGLSLLR